MDPITTPGTITISMTEKDTTITSWDGYLAVAGGATINAPASFAAVYNGATGWDVGGGGISVPIWTAPTADAHLGTGTVGADCQLGLMATVATAGVLVPAQVSMHDVTFGIDLDGTPYEGVVEVNVLPEPVSALLLLAGMPLLRRRR